MEVVPESVVNFILLVLIVILFAFYVNRVRKGDPFIW